jgi:alpha-tubulin suppressor-like RCC1 family protein
MSLYLEPEYVGGLVHTKIVDISCGDDYWIALDKDGKLYAYGAGKTGVLGEANVKQLNQPRLIEALADQNVKSVSAGWKHAAAVVEE